METSHQLLTQEKRQSNSKDVKIQFYFLTEEFSYFHVLDADGKIKYTGRIEPKKSLTEGCSCPDQFHRNTKSFQDEHGYSLQCKHMIQAKKLRGWN